MLIDRSPAPIAREAVVVMGSQLLTNLSQAFARKPNLVSSSDLRPPCCAVRTQVEHLTKFGGANLTFL